ncbi:EamA family transporter [Nocardia sp. NPDC050193]
MIPAPFLVLAAAVVVVVFRPRRMPRTARQIAAVAGLGVAIAGMNLIYPALQYLPLGIASTIQLLGPLTVAVVGSRSARDLAWPPICCCPALSPPHSALGIALPVAACLGFPAGIASNGGTVFQPQILLLGSTVAVLSAVIPYSLEMAALKRIPAGTAGILLSLEPVVAALAGLLVLGESLSVPRWFAIACICAATAVAVGATGRAGNAGADASAPGARSAAPDGRQPR